MIQPIVQKMIDDGYGVYAREVIPAVNINDTGDKSSILKTPTDVDHPTLGPKRCVTT